MGNSSRNELPNLPGNGTIMAEPLPALLDSTRLKTEPKPDVPGQIVGGAPRPADIDASGATYFPDIVAVLKGRPLNIVVDAPRFAGRA